MIQQILEKSCVRIKIKNSTITSKQGSGVIIAHEHSFYILTAMHCLGDSIPDIENIVIETQEDYSSDFKNIKVVSIKNFDKEKDWALIEIDFDEEENLLKKIRLGHGFVNTEKVIFYGYQSISDNQFRPFNGKILLITNDKLNFQIKLADDTFNQAGEDGKFIAQGLSGSGVFIIKNKNPYLIGILNSVKSEKAWNDDISCCSINNLSDIIERIENLSDFEFLKQWEENLENEKTEGI